MLTSCVEEDLVNVENTVHFRNKQHALQHNVKTEIHEMKKITKCP